MNIDKICELASQLVDANSNVKELVEHKQVFIQTRGGRKVMSLDDVETSRTINFLVDLKKDKVASLVLELGNEINKEDMGG